MPTMSRAAVTFRRFVWNRTSLTAILMSSPAILAAGSSFVMSRSVDADIAELTRQRDHVSETSRQLDSFTREVERLQLDRASLLLVMNAEDADVKLKFALDRLFRLNALNSMRRVAATLYPAEWAGHVQPYEELVQQDYDGAGTVRELQGMESGMIAEAGRQLTLLQESFNSISNEIERKTAFRTTILSVGNSLMYILTIMTFFLGINQKARTAGAGTESLAVAGEALPSPARNGG